MPCRARAAPCRLCDGRLCLASRYGGRAAWSGKGQTNLINYGIRFCHKQIFCHCSASLLKFTVRGTCDDICIINNHQAGVGSWCISAAMIRESKARLRCSPVLSAAEQVERPQLRGSLPGPCLAFIFNTLLPGGDKPSLSEVIAN